MSEQTMEDILNALYDLIQDARNAPLSADKCVVERDKVLDMLDEDDDVQEVYHNWEE